MVFAFLAITGPLAGQQPGGSGPPLNTPPRTAYPRQAMIKPEAFWDSNGLMALVTMNTLDKRISLQWSYDDASGQRQFLRETFDVSYWPTAASRFDKGHLVVAGKRPSNGKTVIERWDVNISGIPGTANPGGGTYETELNKTVLFNQNVAGKKTVRMLTEVIDTDKVLVHFTDSSDLYMLEVITNTLTLVYTALEVPKLTLKTIRHVSVAEHPTMGYAYIYGADADTSDDGWIIFYDTDKDGTLDTWVSVDYSQWPQYIRDVDWVRVFDI